MRIADIPKHALITLIRAYKYAVSPLLPSACRYVPTCSEYAIEAIDRHGVVRGATMAGWRLLRCHPFAGGGFDPVRFPGVPSPRRDSMSRAPGSRETRPLAFWEEGRKHRLEMRLPEMDKTMPGPSTTH